MPAEQVIKHRWVTGATDADLTGAQSSLKKFNASRKLKKATMGLVAKMRMEKLMTAGLAAKAEASEASRAK